MRRHKMMGTLSKCHNLWRAWDQSSQPILFSICVGVNTSIWVRTDTFQHLLVTESNLEMQMARTLLESVTPDLQLRLPRSCLIQLFFLKCSWIPLTPSGKLLLNCWSTWLAAPTTRMSELQKTFIVIIVGLQSIISSSPLLYNSFLQWQKSPFICKKTQMWLAIPKIHKRNFSNCFGT